MAALTGLPALPAPLSPTWPVRRPARRSGSRR